MGGFLSSLAAGVVLFLLGFLAHHLTVRWSLRHLRGFVRKHRVIRIVVPSFIVPEFEIEGATGKAQIPSNVVVMPMAEGRGIAELVKTFQVAFSRVEIQLIPHTEFSDDGVPFISVGGPSVNSVSKNLLEQKCPNFTLLYPEHVASYGTTEYRPELKDDYSLREDYGFVLFSHTPEETPFLVVCGVWAFGTYIAIQALLSPQRGLTLEDLYRNVKKKRPFFAICHGHVDSLDVSGAQPITLHRL